jgi:hypothetical protein
MSHYYHAIQEILFLSNVKQRSDIIYRPTPYMYEGSYDVVGSIRSAIDRTQSVLELEQHGPPPQKFLPSEIRLQTEPLVVIRDNEFPVKRGQKFFLS